MSCATLHWCCSFVCAELRVVKDERSGPSSTGYLKHLPPLKHTYDQSCSAGCLTAAVFSTVWKEILLAVCLFNNGNVFWASDTTLQVMMQLCLYCLMREFIIRNINLSHGLYVFFTQTWIEVRISVCFFFLLLISSMKAAITSHRLCFNDKAHIHKKNKASRRSNSIQAATLLSISVANSQR